MENSIDIVNNNKEIPQLDYWTGKFIKNEQNFTGYETKEQFTNKLIEGIKGSVKDIFNGKD
jgi:hypothetical protein